jgi:D-arabinose 1-dehydrogenase-like Zn-dependent alcohol dehydrogenase
MPDSSPKIGRLIDQGKVRPAVMAIHPLAEARLAYERLTRGHVRRKIVLVVSE